MKKSEGRVLIVTCEVRKTETERLGSVAVRFRNTYPYRTGGRERSFHSFSNIGGGGKGNSLSTQTKHGETHQQKKMNSAVPQDMLYWKKGGGQAKRRLPAKHPGVIKREEEGPFSSKEV